MFWIVVLDVFGPGFEGTGEEQVFINARGGDLNDAFAIEEKSDGSGDAKGSAKFREAMADLTGGSIAVIGGGFHDDGDAAGPIAFVGDFFVDGSIDGARSFINGAVDVFGGHIDFFSGGNSGPKSGIGVGVAPAQACSNRNFADNAGENLSAAGIDNGFFMAYGVPFAMAGHG